MNDASPAGRARALLAALTTSISGPELDTARQVLAGGDPDVAEELRRILDEVHAEEGTPAPEPRTRGLGAGAPERIGPWRVVRLLGEGGFGAVYLAERADELFHRQVAIKLLRERAGSRTLLTRFDAERRILAMLQHPNIAQLIDAGSTADGMPYFVMEFVDGSSLMEYIAVRKLDQRQILSLFVPICQALDFAHQRLVVHRDLKPGNIFVSEQGEVKLLDFGIAKLLDDHASSGGGAPLTVPGSQPMTPLYASPEQLRGEPVSTRTDVFALGVVLYQALSGRLPHPGPGLDKVIRGILDEDPPPPTAAGGRRSPEIDDIVLMALRKDPGQRYSSAGAMGADIESFLNGEPVRAHGSSRRYRTMKFVRRHRGAALAAGLLVFSLVGGIVATTRESRVARAERLRAEDREREANTERGRAQQQAQLAVERQKQAEAARAQAQERAADVRNLARDLLVELQETVSKLPGGGVAHEQLVNRAIAYLQRLEQDSSGEVELEAAIALGYRKLGDVYNFIYRPGTDSSQRQLDAYRKSAERMRPLAAAEPANRDWRGNLAAAEAGAGDALERMDRTREAKQAWSEAVRLTEGMDTVEALVVRGAAQMQLARQLWRETARAESPLRLARQAVEWKRAAATAEPRRPNVWRQLANHQAALALILAESGDEKGSLETLKEANRSLDAAVAQQADDFLSRRDRVAFLLLQGNFESRFGRTEQAADTFRSAVQTAERLLEIDATNINVRYDLGNSRNWLGDMLSRLGKAADARTQFEAMSKIAGELAAADSGNRAFQEMLHVAHLRLGDSFADENRYAEAEPAYRAALAVSERLVALSKGSPAMLRENAFSCGRLAEVGLNTNRPEAALEWARKAVALHARTTQAEPRNAEYLLSLSLAWGMQGQIERRLRRLGGSQEELPSLRQAFELGERALGLHPNDRDKMSFLAGHAHPLGQRLIESGAIAEAQATLRRGRALLEQLTAADPNVPRYRRELALVLSLLGEAEQQGGDKEQACKTLARSREMAKELEKQSRRPPNPLLAEERFARLMAGCRGGG